MHIFRFYKVNPHDMLAHMSMADLQGFIQNLEYETRQDYEKSKQNNTGSNLMNSLYAIHQILTVMFEKSPPR